MKIVYPIWALCLLALLCCQACLPTTSNKKLTAANASFDSQDIFSDDYYVNNAHNNLARLHLLLQGLFSTHVENIEKGTSRPWLVNGDQDSILVYNIQIGEPSKNGYWLYLHQFISNMPDAPIYTAFQHLRQVSRDTISATFYEVEDPPSFEDLKIKGSKVFEELDFSSLRIMEEEVMYVKSANALFYGASCIYKNPKADKDDYRKDIYSISPQAMAFNVEYYDERDSAEGRLSNVKMVLYRIDPQNNAIFNPKLK